MGGLQSVQMDLDLAQLIGSSLDSLEEFIRGTMDPTWAKYNSRIRACCIKIETIVINDDAARVVTAKASSSAWLLSPLQPEVRYPSHRLC